MDPFPDPLAEVRHHARFAWPALGRLAIEALFAFDYPLLQGVVITFTLMYITAAFVVDVLYAYVDPRIRYA